MKPALLALSLAACAPETAMTTVSPKPEPDPPPMSLELPRIVPIPDIPAALHGCWDSIPPEEPEEPGGPHRLVVTDRTIEEIATSYSKIATAEYVTNVTPTLIEGLFSAPDEVARSTIATALRLGDGGDYGPRDHLNRKEGDAGSTIYARCRDGAPSPNPRSGVERG